MEENYEGCRGRKQKFYAEEGRKMGGPGGRAKWHSWMDVWQFNIGSVLANLQEV